MVSEDPFICLHPAWCGGEATIGLSRLPAQVIADAWWSGMAEDDIYKNWPSCKGRPELLLSCWWVARYKGGRSHRLRWGAWLEEAEGPLWKLDYKGCPLPPRREAKVPGFEER